MKSKSIISAIVFLLGGCAAGSKLDVSQSNDVEEPSLVLPGLSAVDVSKDIQPQMSGAGGDGGSSQGEGGETDSSASGSSVSSSSSSGGGNQPPPQVVCNQGLTLCGDVCYDTKADVLNCGACGHTCKDGQYCSDGKCTVSAVLHVAGDDACDAYLDGKLVATNQNWFVATKVSLKLTAGTHVVAVLGKNAANGTHPGAVILDLGFGSQRIATGSDWGSSTEFVAGWETLGGSLLNPTSPVTHEGIFNTMWWNRDPVTFAAKNFPDDSKAMWVWSQGFVTDPVVYLRKEFVVE